MQVGQLLSHRFPFSTAHVDLFSDVLVGHAVIVPLDLDVVINADADLRPLGIDIELLGQRPEHRALAHPEMGPLDKILTDPLLTAEEVRQYVGLKKCLPTNGQYLTREASLQTRFFRIRVPLATVRMLFLPPPDAEP